MAELFTKDTVIELWGNGIFCPKCQEVEEILKKAGVNVKSCIWDDEFDSIDEHDKRLELRAALAFQEVYPVAFFGGVAYTIKEAFNDLRKAGVRIPADAEIPRLKAIWE